MSLPTSPTAGDTYTTPGGVIFTYTAYGAWKASGSSGSSSSYTPLSWTTATRPSSPSVGTTGYNTTLSVLETWNGTAWTSVGPTASGGGSSDPWANVPVGGFIWYDAGEGLSDPPTDQSYRYVNLTAGLTGAGGYNNGVLTSESVSGSAPSIVATAVVSLAGSALNGKTIHLLNTERRFMRPGSAGTLEESANLAHNHGGETGDLAVATALTLPHQQGNPGSYGGYHYGDGYYPPKNVAAGTISAHKHTINSDGGTEARPRNIGVILFRRVL